MAAYVSLIPGTSILEYCFSHDLNLDQYQDCIMKASRILCQLPDGPVYALFDLGQLRTIPFNFFQTTKRLQRPCDRIEGVAIVRASAFYKMLVRLALRVLRSREVHVAFCDCRDEALLALGQMARLEWSEQNLLSSCA